MTGRSLNRNIIIGAAVLGLVISMGYRAAIAREDTSADTVTGEYADGNLSPEQMLSQVEQTSENAKVVFRRVQEMLDQARREKDAIKITCLDDKLTQVHVNMRGIDDRSVSFRESIGSGDIASARQQFAILEIYRMRIQGLAASAESCVGDSDVFLGDSKTAVTVGEDITIDDPSTVPSTLGTKEIVEQLQQHTNGTVGVERLTVASGYY